jgi:hypothetical protein
MDKKDLKEIRKQKFAQMEQQLKETHPKEEDRMFYYHSSEERIVLSHALFWTMTSFRNPPSPLPKGAPPLPISPLLRRGDN